MSIQSSNSSDTPGVRSRPADQARAAPRNGSREPATAEQVEKFRNLMHSHGAEQVQKADAHSSRLLGRDAAEIAPGARGQATQSAQTATEQAVRFDSGDQRHSGGWQADGGELQSAEIAALQQAHVAVRETAAMPPAAAPTAQFNPRALADMLERHVRQFAVGSGARAGENGEVLLRLNDRTLPGTDLLLTRTENGWLLRADVRSRSSYEAIEQSASRLTERFASRRLGTLEVSPHYVG